MLLFESFGMFYLVAQNSVEIFGRLCAVDRVRQKVNTDRQIEDMLFELMWKIWIMSEFDSVFLCRYYVFALPAHCAEFAKYGFHVGSRVGSVIGIALDIDARLILAYVADERPWIGDPADNENRVVARHALQPRYRCHFVGKNGDKMSVEIAREI